MIDGAGISRLVWSGFTDCSYKVVDCYLWRSAHWYVC